MLGWLLELLIAIIEYVCAEYVFVGVLMSVDMDEHTHEYNT